LPAGQWNGEAVDAVSFVGSRATTWPPASAMMSVMSFLLIIAGLSNLPFKWK